MGLCQLPRASPACPYPQGYPLSAICPQGLCPMVVKCMWLRSRYVFRWRSGTRYSRVCLNVSLSRRDRGNLNSCKTRQLNPQWYFARVFLPHHVRQSEIENIFRNTALYATECLRILKLSALQAGLQISPPSGIRAPKRTKTLISSMVPGIEICSFAPYLIDPSR
jgi:hypothetical protein